MAVAQLTAWATCCAHVARTPHSPRSKTWRRVWVATVSISQPLAALNTNCSAIFCWDCLIVADARPWQSVDFESFQRILNRPGGFRDPGEPEEYCRGFQVFDKDMTGFIGVGQLKYILTNLGEKMTDEEVDELLKAVDTSSGQVNYTGTLMLPCTSLALANYLCLTCRAFPPLADLVRTILAN